MQVEGRVFQCEENKTCKDIMPETLWPLCWGWLENQNVIRGETREMANGWSTSGSKEVLLYLLSYRETLKNFKWRCGGEIGRWRYSKPRGNLECYAVIDV